jgi:diacylglycerol kinase (ATP)
VSQTDTETRFRRALLIVNPSARLALRARDKALAAFQQANVSCEAIVTEAPGHATDLARERSAAYDAVFTLGGDGTAMEVITALADGGPPVGILPGGTGNILGRALGIPLRIDRAVRALLRGDEALIDLGRLHHGRHFAIGVGVGLDEAMIAGASPLMKKRVGFWAYVWSAMKASTHLESFAVRLTVDGTVYEQRAASVLIANLGAVLGGRIRFGEHIVHDDGLLHACLYSPSNFWDMLRIFARMMFGNVQKDRCAMCVSGRQFLLETDPPRRAQADGELLDMTPLEVTVRPNAGRLLIPKRKGPRSS